MNDVYAIAAAALGQDAQSLRSVSQNISNLSTPGYKREVAYQRSFGAALEASEVTSRAAGAGAPPMPVRAYDPAAGTLRKTDRVLDLAIAGEGYFEVMLEDGPAYTRQGNFRLDPQGRLVTERGEPVMGLEGEIGLTTESISVTSRGEIKDGDRVVGHLKIVVPGNVKSAEKVGSGLIRAAGAATQPELSAIDVRQGYLENSNVSLTTEMVQMMQTLRHFESMQRVTQQFDELVGNAIRKLGEN